MERLVKDAGSSSVSGESASYGDLRAALEKSHEDGSDFDMLVFHES